MLINSLGYANYSVFCDSPHSLFETSKGTLSITSSLPLHTIEQKLLNRQREIKKKQYKILVFINLPFAISTTTVVLPSPSQHVT